MRRRVPVVAGLLVSAMLISLVGCGSSKQPQNSQLGTGIGNTVETQSQDNTDSQLGTDVEPETQPSTEPDEKPSVNPEVSKYTYTEVDKTMWTTSGLNVRDLPKTDGAKLGQLALGAEVHVAIPAAMLAIFASAIPQLMCLSGNCFWNIPVLVEPERSASNTTTFG